MKRGITLALSLTLLSGCLDGLVGGACAGGYVHADGRCVPSATRDGAPPAISPILLPDVGADPTDAGADVATAPSPDLGVIPPDDVTPDVPRADVPVAGDDRVEVDAGSPWDDVPDDDDLPVAMDVPAPEDAPEAADVATPDAPVVDDRPVIETDVPVVIPDDITLPCPPLASRCGSACVDLNADAYNCGACGNRCAAGEYCSAGACASICGARRRFCDGACVDIEGDTYHCGACGNRCAAGEYCAAGACAQVCGTRQSYCDGACVDTNGDTNNCGACGARCPGGEYCVAGECSRICPLPLELCGGRCVDPSSDADHCGSCGATCLSGVCNGGQCRREGVGHLALIGHDYAVGRYAQNLVVGNAVFMGNPAPRILLFSQWAPPTNATNTLGAIQQVAAGVRRYTTQTLANYRALPTELTIDNFDVLVVLSQGEASDEQLGAAARLAGPAITSFVRAGGSVVVLDGEGNNAGTWQFAAASGLIPLTGHVVVTAETLTVENGTDALGIGLPLAYRAERSSVAFRGSNSGTVVSSAFGPVVIHRGYTPSR
jgi:hypothetical protein